MATNLRHAVSRSPRQSCLPVSDWPSFVWRRRLATPHSTTTVTGTTASFPPLRMSGAHPQPPRVFEAAPAFRQNSIRGATSRCGSALRGGSDSGVVASTHNAPLSVPCSPATLPDTRRRLWMSTAAAAIEASGGLVPPATFSALATPGIDALLRDTGLDRAYLEGLAHQRPTPLRLQDMYQYGTSIDPMQRLRNAQFLYKEMPVRIAQRAVDLLTLPHGLSEAGPIREVATIYLNYLRRLKEFPSPTTVEMEERFTDLMQSFVLDRASIPVSIAQGVKTWWLQEQRGGDADESRLQQMEEALYRFFTARVGLRFLTEHFVLSSNRDSAQRLRLYTSMFPLSDSPPTRGCIHANVNVAQEARRVADLVTEQTAGYHDGLCPAVDIVDCVSAHEFTHVPHHLHFMLAELLTNACRASVRRYRACRAAGDAAYDMPRIRVIIVKGAEDVTIKVADRGGGIPRSLMATIWKFAHSTASASEWLLPAAAIPTDAVDFSSARIRGFGLPLARIYARYFGGELTLKSTEGDGLDAYLHLPRLGDACENLPLRVRDSPGERDSLPPPPPAPPPARTVA